MPSVAHSTAVKYNSSSGSRDWSPGLPQSWRHCWQACQKPSSTQLCLERIHSQIFSDTDCFMPTAYLGGILGTVAASLKCQKCTYFSPTASYFHKDSFFFIAGWEGRDDETNESHFSHLYCIFSFRCSDQEPANTTCGGKAKIGAILPSKDHFWYTTCFQRPLPSLQSLLCWFLLSHCFPCHHLQRSPRWYMLEGSSKQGCVCVAHCDAFRLCVLLASYCSSDTQC